MVGRKPEVRSPAIFAAGSAPEAVFWSVLLALCAVWAGRTGPGRASSLLSAGIQGLVWAGLYIGLALAYGASTPERGQATRVLRRLEACLLLALMATHLVRLLLSHFAPSLWMHSFYLRALLPLVFAGVWCPILLPRDTLN